MSIHAGGYAMFYLTDNKLYGTGWNYNCVLGGTRDNSICVPREMKIPNKKATILKFKIGILSYSTIVLTDKGLYGCGDGGNGQFGNGGKNSNRKMKLLQFYKNKSVENYWSESFALWVLLRNRKILRSGSNDRGRLAHTMNKENIVRPEELDQSFLSTGEIVQDIKSYFHTLLLTDKGRVYSCGDGSKGKRGMGGNKREHSSLSFEMIKFFENKEVVAQISLGWEHSIFVTSFSNVYSCGGGDSGHLGHNIAKQRCVPTIVNALKNTKIKKVCCGDHFTMFLGEGTVFACGRNDYGQLGLGNVRSVNIPTKVSTPFYTFDLATTRSSSIFLTRNGAVFGVGANNDGQLGLRHRNHPIKSISKTEIKISVVQEVGLLFEEIPKKLFDVVLVTEES